MQFVNLSSTKRFVPPLVFISFRLFVLLRTKISKTCFMVPEQEQNPLVSLVDLWAHNDDWLRHNLPYCCVHPRFDLPMECFSSDPQDIFHMQLFAAIRCQPAVSCLLFTWAGINLLSKNSYYGKNAQLSYMRTSCCTQMVFCAITVISSWS